jgi:lipopolysaccharide assembly outer membrane protein LptD (OstA)
VFEKGIGPFAKFKHIFEPRWGYRFIGEFEDQNLVPLFDEVDILRSSNIFGYALVNRVLAKPADEELLGGPREIFSFELNQSFSLNDDEPLQASSDGTLSTTEGPIGALLRFNPSEKMSLEARAQYSTLFSNLASTSLTSSFGVGRQRFGLSWFTRYNAETGDEASDQVRFSATLAILPGRLSFGSQIAYDVLADFVQAHRQVLEFTGQCWGFRLDYTQVRTVRGEDYDIRFALSLKNIGTFLDLTGGSRGGQF